MSSIVVASTFLLFLAVTRHHLVGGTPNKRHQDYAAGGRITGFQNGLAIAGDFMSAATFLGITGLTYLAGLDATIYVLAPMVGFCLLLMLMVEPFRRLGRFTVYDVAAHRFERKSVRVFAAFTSLVIVLLYLVSQMVGAGALVQLLFGIPYAPAVVTIGALMVFYVSVGGMMATTWVQIIKAVLMISRDYRPRRDDALPSTSISRGCRGGEVHRLRPASSYPEVSSRIPGPRSRFRSRWSSASSGFRTS
jgi:cation/acetate symporter